MLRTLSVVWVIGLALTGMFAGQSHRVALVCGPAVQDPEQLDAARKGLYRSLRERADIRQIIFMGDLVMDDASLLSPTRATLDSLSCPWFCVPGDGDRDFYRPATSLRPGGHLPSRDRDFVTWQAVMPSSDTSWVARGIRWIVLNNIRTISRTQARTLKAQDKGLYVGNDYTGGLNERQKRWLEDWLIRTPERQWIALCTHLPLSQCAGADSLAHILSRHKNTRQICAVPCSDPEVISVSGHGGIYTLDIRNGGW